MLAFCHEKVMNTVKLMWFFEFKPKNFFQILFGEKGEKVDYETAIQDFVCVHSHIVIYYWL